MARDEITELEREVRRHNHLYWDLARPEISDADYDALIRRLRAVEPDSQVLDELGPSRIGLDVVHSAPMLSLDKCYSAGELADWVAKFAGDVVATPKIDGCATALRYDERGRLVLAATRGDGTRGEEVTANARQVSDVPARIGAAAGVGPLEVRGEIFMRLSVFERFRGEFANPRNLAAGALKQKEPGQAGAYDLSFLAYDVLGPPLKDEVEKLRFLAAIGFTVPLYELVPRDQVQAAFERFAAHRAEIDFEIDGVVFKANSLAEQRRLGATAHHPRFAIAYKLQGDERETTLVDIEWGVSRTGAITPVGIVQAVELSGATVTRASLHHAGIVASLGLTRGARVAVMRRGGVIPNIERVISAGGERFVAPARCPSCGGATRLDGDFLCCADPARCGEARVGAVLHFVAELEIDGFGDKLVRQLFERGLVADGADLYRLSSESLRTLERMGPALASKLIKALDARREVPLDAFLRALGIPELGRHVATVLAGIGDLARVRALRVEELTAIHSIGEAIATSVVEGLAARARLIERLLEVVRVVREEPAKAKGSLAGKKVVFTGTLAKWKRADAQRVVRERGGETPDQVVKDLDYLVVGAGGGPKSTKQKRAEALVAEGAAITILTEDEFSKLVS